LELWPGRGRDVGPLAELRLAQLDLSPGLLATLAQSATDGLCIERFEAVPGIHYVLVVPLRNGTVLTVGVGPRTRWLSPTRVARFLHGDMETSEPYTIFLSPVEVGTAAMGPPGVARRHPGGAGRARLRAARGGARRAHLRAGRRRCCALRVRDLLVVLRR